MQLTQLVEFLTSELQVCASLLFDYALQPPEFASNAQNHKDSMSFLRQSKLVLTEARIEVF